MSAPLCGKLSQLHRAQLQKRQREESQRRKQSSMVGHQPVSRGAAGGGGNSTFNASTVAAAPASQHGKLTMKPTWQVAAQQVCNVTS